MYTVVLKTQDYQLNFYNQILPNAEVSKVTGLFKKESGHFGEVIGAPIFALGKYYKFSLTKTAQNNFQITRETYRAAIFTWMKVNTNLDECIIR